MSNNLAIDNLIQSSLASDRQLKWIPTPSMTDIRSGQIDTIHYLIYKLYMYGYEFMLLLLGSDETCTPAFVSEFARIYSLLTHKHDSNNDNFKRYSKWLYYRNKRILGFTKYDDKYYMLANQGFYHYCSRYGICSACGILRCSPVWCVCGHKQISNGWTSNSKQIDQSIKRSQLQTNSPNDAYLEWIPYDCIYFGRCDIGVLDGLPTNIYVELIPLEITDETPDLYYAKLCDEFPDILTTDVWVTIGFTYNAREQAYYLIKPREELGLCLACTEHLLPEINTFCYACKAPQPLDWTTGNKSLDSFIMESWSNVAEEHDAYIQWIDYLHLTNVQQVTSLHYRCTHAADWLRPTTNKYTQVTLKRIVENRADQSFDFYQLTKEYPEILMPDNIWIIGITQELCTWEYYLVFYHDVCAILDEFMQVHTSVKYIQYAEFDKIKEIGSGGYATIYTASYSEEDRVKTVVLKCYKSFDGSLELFISEFRNRVKCLSYEFLNINGITQDPETKEYIMVMQYANNGSLLSYLDQNINNLMWRMKLQLLKDIARQLTCIHGAGLVHCDLHGGNIVMHDRRNNDVIEALICDLSLSRPVISHKSNANIQGVLPFIAPEVFYTRKFTQKSDIYSFGMMMYLMATGEPPFRDRQFDTSLLCDIVGGLRPLMPDSAPEEYKKLAEQCCNADPDKRFEDGKALYSYIYNLVCSNSDNAWEAVYHNNDV